MEAALLKERIGEKKDEEIEKVATRLKWTRLREHRLQGKNAHVFILFVLIG